MSNSFKNSQVRQRRAQASATGPSDDALFVVFLLIFGGMILLLAACGGLA